MADELLSSHFLNVKTLVISRASSLEQLRSDILNCSEPCLLSKASSDWACSSWTPEFLARKLDGWQTSFRICAKVDSQHYQFQRSQVVMESDCYYAKGTLMQYCAWLEDDLTHAGELAKYPRARFWCYADYKHMAKIFKDLPELRRAPEWGKLGFPEISGDQSTIWIGSECSLTPCHLDTYGCNLVSQIYGKKRWCLFPPSETRKLYPTRIPYEESSIFSKVNIQCPDLNRTPEYHNAMKYEVVLEPGDVLLVPRHWWHYVESLEPSISINTWIPLESDHVDRVREAVTRMLVCSMKCAEEENPQKWLNPTEYLGSHNQHIVYIQNAVNGVIEQDRERNGETLGRTDCPITNNDIVDCITSPQIVTAIADQLIAKGRTKSKNIESLNGGTRKRESEIATQKEPSQNSCNCKCCLSEGNKHGMMTRHTKRTLEQNACLSCCKDSSQKKKRT